MRRIEQEAVVVELACLTADRSKQEQKALMAIAERVDRERNRIAGSNPRSRWVRECPGTAFIHGEGVTIAKGKTLAAASREAWLFNDHKRPDKHSGSCVCHGAGLIPADGLSLLARQVELTWEPDE